MIVTFSEGTHAALQKTSIYSERVGNTVDEGEHCGVGKGGDDGTGKGKGVFAATRCAIQSSALWKCVSVWTI